MAMEIDVPCPACPTRVRNASLVVQGQRLHCSIEEEHADFYLYIFLISQRKHVVGTH